MKPGWRRVKKNARLQIKSSERAETACWRGGAVTSSTGVCPADQLLELRRQDAERVHARAARGDAHLRNVPHGGAVPLPDLRPSRRRPPRRRHRYPPSCIPSVIPKRCLILSLVVVCLSIVDLRLSHFYNAALLMRILSHFSMIFCVFYSLNCTIFMRMWMLIRSLRKMGRGRRMVI